MNNENIDTDRYVEDYYRNLLNTEQKKQFEEKIIKDSVFAEKVAFYLSTIIASNEIHQEETRQRFKEIYQNKKQVTKVVRFKKPYAYIISSVAAILVMIVGYLVFFQPTATHLANKYINNNLLQISPVMGSANDSIQQGVSYYNEKNYDSALYIFKSYYDHNPNSYQTLEHLCQSYLKLKDYDVAMANFDTLLKRIKPSPPEESIVKSGIINFNKAIALLGRNKPGDKQQATQILQKIVKEKGYGEAEAKELLDKL